MIPVLRQITSGEVQSARRVLRTSWENASEPFGLALGHSNRPPGGLTT